MTASRCSPGGRTRSRTLRATTRRRAGIAACAPDRWSACHLTAPRCSLSRMSLDDRWMPSCRRWCSRRSQVTSPATPVPPRQRPKPAPLPRRFHGSVALDTARVGRDAGKIAEEVIAHLAGLVGAEVTVTLEIHAEVAVRSAGQRRAHRDRELSDAQVFGSRVREGIAMGLAWRERPIMSEVDSRLDSPFYLGELIDGAA